MIRQHLDVHGVVCVVVLWLKVGVSLLRMGHPGIFLWIPKEDVMGWIITFLG